jgi:uncharacterized damage-inducible protein DinB
MHLTIDELMCYTSEERAKWQDWFARHGDAALRLPLAGATHATVGALVMHIFRPEQRYVQRMRGQPLTAHQDFSTETWEGIFAYGRQSRDALRTFVKETPPEAWGRLHEFTVRPNARHTYQIRATTRKLIGHLLMHEIRHWAQIARVVRERGLAPPREHDLLWSIALE